ncbi:MAG: PAS domain S-box protein [Chloroflexota bacterium]|nr:MAG: PAS domain S-box protein [Chloroflexota bacterium]
MTSETAETLLVERDGDQVLFLNELRHQKETALKLRIPLSQQEVPAVMAVLGIAGVVEGKDYRGVEVLAALTHIPNSPWYTVAKIDTSEALSVWRSQAGMIIAFFTGLLVAALALVGFIWQRRQMLAYQALYQAEAERKKLEKHLIDSEAKYRRLFETAQDAILILDGETGQIIDANPFIKDMLGYTLEELQGKHLWEIGTFQDIVSSKAAYEKLAQKGYIRYEHLPLQSKDGRLIHVEFVSNRYKVDNRDVFQCNIRDITERKRAEEVLRQSEEKYRDLVETIPDVVFAVDKNGTVTYLSPAVEPMTGYSVSELMGQTFADFLHPEDLAHAFEAFQRTLSGETVVDEARFFTKSGETRWLRNSNKPIFAGDQVVGVRGVFSDITESKRAEEALRQSEERYRTILEQMDESYYEIDLAGNFTFVNDALCHRLGRSREELIGMNYRAYTPKERVDNTFKTFNTVYRTGQPIKEIPAVTIAGDGSLRFVERSIFPILDREGKVAGFRGISHDITERKLAEELIRLRLELFEFSATHYLDELLQKTLDEIGQLTSSPIGFYHFMEDDQKTLSLQAWSTRTVKEFCKAEGKGTHYDIDQAGVWIDCVRERRPVIHNDYASLPHRKGMPEGHAIVTRELVVPIMRSDRIVAVLGIGNKPSNYTDRDVEIVSYLADVAWEITERKRAEDALQQSEGRYRTILNEIQEAYYELDLAGNYTFFNDALCRQTGYSREELMGMNYRRYVPEEDWKTTYERFNHVYRTGEPLRWAPLKAIAKDGRIIHTEDNVVPLHNESGEIIGFRGVSRDITERKLAEEEKKQLEIKAQITSRLASVGEMAAGVAHEINNPLTGVTGYAQLLMDRDDIPADIRSDLVAINEGAQRVAGIVQRLLAFSRQTKPERKLADINELIESTLILRAYHLRVNNIEVVTKLAPALLETVVDPGQIQQVLLNLIVNAETEMKLAQGRGKLTITTERSDSTIKIYVKDDGPGIKPEVIDRIFDPFFTTRETGQGTGLGLSLCYGIITEHNGKIYAESNTGKGATFIVELPVVTEVEPLKPDKPDVKKSKKKIKARILVVDDEKVVRDIANRVLTGEGHKVETIHTADEALKKIEGHKYDLILLDIKMPGMNGMELYKRIQKIDKSLAQGVVFITGDVMGADTEKFLSDNKVAHIEKPFSAEELSSEVKHALAGGQ